LTNETRLFVTNNKSQDENKRTVRFTTHTESTAFVLTCEK
jgi:hypothetical protein